MNRRGRILLYRWLDQVMAVVWGIVFLLLASSVASMAWVGVARAAPAGDGWQQCGPGQCVLPGDSATTYDAAADYASDLCGDPPAWSYFPAVGGQDLDNSRTRQCWTPGFAELLEYPGQVWYRALAVPPAEDGIDWESPASVLAVLVWGLVCLGGFHGYSVGARDA